MCKTPRNNVKKTKTQQEANQEATEFSAGTASIPAGDDDTNGDHHIMTEQSRASSHQLQTRRTYVI